MPLAALLLLTQTITLGVCDAWRKQRDARIQPKERLLMHMRDNKRERLA